jgi:hypothetical protein
MGIGGSVNHGQDVGVTLENEKRTNNVHMEMGRSGMGMGRGGNTGVDFCFLARKTQAGPLIDTGGRVGPVKMGRI